MAALISVALGQIQFGGYDTSPLIDIGWRLHLGQRPYVDFPCMLPPSFYALSWLAIVLFGVHWYAFTIMGSLVTMLLLCLALHAHRCMYPILTRQHRFILGLYASAMAFPMLVTSHLWHSTFAAQTNTTLLFLLLFLFSHREQNGRWSVSGFICTALAFCPVWLAKPNTAIVCIGVSILFPLHSPSRREALKVWLALATSGFVLSMIVLTSMTISPLQVWKSYLRISDRPSIWSMLGDGIFYEQTTPGSLSSVTSYVIAIVLLVTSVYVLVRRSADFTSPYLVILMGGFAISLTGFATNWDLKFNDLAPVFFGAGTFLTLPAPNRKGPTRVVVRTLVASSILGLGMALILSCTRARMVSGGDWAETPSAGTTFHTDPFLGYFGGSDRLWRVLAQADQLYAANTQVSIYAGPRLEFLNAREHLVSPRGLPLWWHLGTSYPITSEAQIVKSWKDSNFDYVVLDTGDDEGLRRLPEGLRAELREQYITVSRSNEPLTVLQRR